MDESLKLLLALQVQALGQEAFDAIAQGLDGIVEHAGAVGPAIAAASAALVGLAAVGAGIGEAVAQAANWQTTITEVANNTNMSTAAMNQMSDAILGMAQTTSAPLDQLAQGYMHVTNMGFQGKDAIDVLNAAMESAVSTGGNVADTANVLANVMHEFALPATDAAHAMDILHTAAALGNMTLEQMTNSFGPVAAIAATLGVPLDQASAAMAAITRHGFDAAEAGTQVKNMLERLAVPTAGAQKELAALSKVTGVDLVDAQRQFAAGTLDLTGYLADLSRATNGNFQAFSQLMGGQQLTQQQMDALTSATHGNIQALQALDPNIRGLYGLFILTGRGAADYASILQQIDASQQGAGITAESYARTQATLGFQLGVLKNNLQVAAIELGQEFLPAITTVVEWVTGTALPAFEGLVQIIGDNLGPALAGIAVVWQQVTAAFQGGGLIAALQTLLGDIGSFAQSMFGAGWNLVATFAQGMMQAADSLITAVVNDIASIIGSFFIGNSPPPAGPLSKIDKGGANTMAAFIGGMQSQLSAGGLSDIAAQIGQQFGGMGQAMGAGFTAVQQQIAATTSALSGLNGQAAGTTAQTKEAAANIKAMQSDLQGETAQVTTALNGINGQLQTLTSQETIVKGVISDITQSYQDQIDPLQQQLDNLKSQVDYAQQLRDAQESVQMAQLDQSILNDQGDPTKRAALEAQLQALQEQQKGLDLKSQIANIEAQKKQAAGNADKLAALNLQEQELQIQQQIYNLTNHPQLAADEAAKAQLAALQAQQAAAQKVADAQKKAAEAAKEKAIADLKAKEAAALAPYQAQLKNLQDQAATLNTQKQQWTDLQNQIKAASQQAQSMASAIGAAAGHLAALGTPKLGGASALKGIGAPTGAAGAAGPLDPNALAAQMKGAMDTAMQASIADANQKARQAAQQWMQGFQAGIQGQIGGIRAAIGGVLGQIGAALAPAAAAFAPLLVSLQNVARFAQAELVPALQQAGQAVQGSIVPALQAIVAVVTADVLPILQRLGQIAVQDVLPPLIHIASWILGTFVPALARVAALVVATVLPVLDDLSAWATANLLPALQKAGDAVDTFVDQVLPKLTAFLDNFLLPGITQTLSDISALWQQVWPGLSTFLSGILTGIEGIIQIAWSIITGLFKAALDLLSGNWQGAWQDMGQMLQGVWDGFQKVVEGGGQALLGIIQTLLNAALSVIKGFAPQWADAGMQLIEGFKQGILDKAKEVADAAGRVVQDAINAAKNALGVHSPSTVFAEIGQNVVAGYIQGIQGAGPLAVQATATMANGLAGGVRPSGAGGGGGVINIYVTGNTVLNDRDADRLATVVGRALVRQTGQAYSMATLGAR